ncbi:MAG: ABC transporter substrate-binding protein [Micrococcales bacterium]|nr:ABC transporter substrate-binding protein [Micrococcales bacterium]
MILKQRRIAASAIAALVVVSLAACGGKGGDGDETPEPPSDDVTTSEPEPEPEPPPATSDTVFKIGYNGDSAHGAWVEAVLNQIHNNLGIEVDSNVYPDFKSLRDAVTSGQIETPFRTGWQADYPGLDNFLGPLYYTNAGSNDGKYSSQAFDDFVNESRAAKSVEDSNAALIKAQEVLFEDLPAVPLWYQNTSGVWNPDNVSDVVFNWKSVPVYNEVKKDSGFVTANAGEPQNPLIPSLTNEVQGGKVLDLIFSMLVAYDNDGNVYNEMADSITSDDNITWTIKIKDGQVFSDGSAVNADAFINAWDDGALASNERLSSYFFERIEGFSYDEDAHIKDTGLAKVDDLTFTVKLVEEVGDFPLQLGYSAFAPLPPSAFDEDGVVTEDFGANPIGNGPLMLDGADAWKHNESITMVPSPSYKGAQKVLNDGVQLTFYESLDAAYVDVQTGDLDIIDAIPEVSITTYKDEFPDSHVNQGGAVFQSFTIPQYLPHFEGDEGKLRRAALSMAIDRAAICDTIFQGTRSPAQDFTSPVVSGWSGNIPGNDVLTFNPEKARELWAQADAINPW